jgi:RHS repeat-associated protein
LWLRWASSSRPAKARAASHRAGGPGPGKKVSLPTEAGWPRCLAFGHLGYNYDSRSTPMTTAAICATREVSWGPSFYRGEQYDSDLALYYLRARYYNPATGRFMSRDPEDHSRRNPNELHKYLYAHGDPINAVDPTGRWPRSRGNKLSSPIDAGCPRSRF